MFHDGSSSSSEGGEPFNAIKAAAEAKRSIGLADIDDPVYQAITAELNNPTPRHAPPAPKRESRYIGKLVEKAVQRKEESERVSERRLVARQREEDALFKGKERFVTSAYRKKLEKDKEKNEIEKMQERREEERRSKGIAGFYDSLLSGGNVAMGGKEENLGSGVGQRGIQDGDENEPAAPASSRDEKASKTGLNVAKKRRRSRFGDAKTASPPAGSDTMPEAEKAEATKQKKEPRKRGLRRNDEKSIEEYRRRYFQRRAKRLAEANG